jgi:hypothetical protein
VKSQKVENASSEQTEQLSENGGRRRSPSVKDVEPEVARLDNEQ